MNDEEDEVVFLFDLDGSLANHDAAVLRDLELIRNPLEEQPVTHTNLWDLDDIPYMKARVDLIRKIPNWWFNLEPIPLGVRLYDLAVGMKDFKVEVLTKGPKKKPDAWTEKVRWCQKHLNEDIDIHVVSNKGRFYGNILYDDYTPYMQKWLKYRKRGLGIMPLTEQNKDFDHPNVLFWDGKDATESLIIIALNRVLMRKPKEDLDISDIRAKQKELLNGQTEGIS